MGLLKMTRRGVRWFAVVTVASYVMVGCGSSANSNDEQRVNSEKIVASTSTPIKPEPKKCTDYVENVQMPVIYCDSGPKVLRIQQALNIQGYSVDPDGYYGPGTRKAVKQYQSANQLSPTGQVDMTTWRALIDKSFPNTNNNSPAGTNSGSGTPTGIVCSNGKTVYSCEARWSDGKMRSVEFPNSGMSHVGQKFIARTDTTDNYGNPYCVYLFSDGQGAFKGGTCAGSSSGGVPAPSKTVIKVECSLRETGLSSSWQGTFYSWTYYNIWSNGTRTVVKIDQGYNPPSDCD
jgi:hypothetical protein